MSRKVVSPVQIEMDQKPKSSHLNYIDKLPDDCVRIPSYLEHQFESLYYSPSNDVVNILKNSGPPAGSKT